MSLFALPTPESYRLANAPLAQALAQVRYPLVAAFESLAGVAPLQQLLSDVFPYLEQERVAEFALVGGPAGALSAGAAETVNWKFSNDDGIVLAVSASSATLSAGSTYAGVEEFAASFRRVLEALHDMRIPRCDRIGVRYLSLAISLPGEDASWRRWFRPEFIGWSGSDVVDPAFVSSALSQVQLVHPPLADLAAAPADVQALVRHGSVPANTTLPGVPPIETADPSYLVDIDVYVVGPQAFDPDSILEQFRGFHSQIDRLFYWSLSEEGKVHFEYAEG